VSFGIPEFKPFSLKEECSHLEDYLVKMALLLILKKDGRDAFKNRIGACTSYIPKDIQQVAYFPYLGDFEGVKAYLKQSSISLQKRFKVQSFYVQAKKIREAKALIFELISYGLADDRFKDPFDRLKYQEKIDRISLGYWRKLFSINLALADNNRSWLTHLLKDLGQVSPQYFSINSLNYSASEMKMIRDYILELLVKLKDRKIDLLRLKVIARKMAWIGKDDLFFEISDELEAEWSLSEIRSYMQNPFWKGEYFDFWYYLILDRTSQAEIDSKIRDILNIELVEEAPFSQFWVFEHYLPSKPKLRDALYERLENRWEKGSLLDSLQVLELLKLAPVKTALSKKVKDLNRANFQLSRELYIRLLNSGHSSQYALYKLYNLGDKDPDHLWWLIL